MKTRSLLAFGPSAGVLGSRRGRWYALFAAAIVLLEVATTACVKSRGASSEDAPVPEPQMSIELPHGETVSVPFVVAGWALDLSSTDYSGIDVVQVMDEGCEGVVIGIAEYGLQRPDIARKFGEQFRYSGWELQVERLRYGEHTLAVRVETSGADDYVQCQAVQITIQ